jgi:type IV pilus assembly protein PilM
MKMKWPVTAKPQVGLDLGNRTLKALKLKKKGEKVFLEKHFFYDLAESNPKFPSVSNLEETLKGLVEVAGLKNQPVASCVDDSEISTFELSLPDMPASDLAEAVASEVEPRINFPLEDASIDHLIVSRSKVDGEDMLTVKVYCARKNEIKSFINILQAAQLQPQSIDVAMLANIEMLSFNDYLESDKFAMVLDMGETKTNAALVRGQKLIVTNTIPVALGSINRRLQEAMGVSYLDAEKLKLHASMRTADEESQANNIVDIVYLELFQQLQRSMEFFRVSTSGQPISRILLIGGGSQYQAVRATIEATCGAETVSANPFRNIEIFAKGQAQSDKFGKIAAHMGTAVGLALRGLNAA